MGFYIGPPKLYEAHKSIVVQTPYDSGFVYAIKEQIPNIERMWTGKDLEPKNVWLVHPKHAKLITDLVAKFYPAPHPTAPAISPIPDYRVGSLKVRYLGTTKPKNEDYAFGMDMQGKWTILIARKTLEDWFQGISQTKDNKVWAPGTYFETLGIPITEDPDVIKNGFRHMARAWHPDVCKEPNATEMFKMINDAYQVLSDAKKLKRYVIGLSLENNLGKDEDDIGFASKRLWKPNPHEYRSPVRCGVLTCKYYESVTRFIVTDIHEWNEITDQYGKVLITSWDPKQNEVVDMWVDPEAF